MVKVVLWYQTQANSASASKLHEKGKFHGQVTTMSLTSVGPTCFSQSTSMASWVPLYDLLMEDGLSLVHKGISGNAGKGNGLLLHYNQREGLQEAKVQACTRPSTLSEGKSGP